VYKGAVEAAQNHRRFGWIVARTGGDGFLNSLRYVARLADHSYDVGERRRDPSATTCWHPKRAWPVFLLIAAGTGTEEALVRARRLLTEPWRRREPDFVERLDVSSTSCRG